MAAPEEGASINKANSEKKADPKETPAYIYILACADGTYYTGWSSDPVRREKVHNSGKGAKYTRSRLPVRLVYTEKLPDRISAMRREYAIKQMDRAGKEKLIGNLK